MKRLIFIFAGLLIVNVAFSQDFLSKTKVGGGLAFGSEIENIGLNVIATYDVFEEFNLRAAPSLTIFLPKKEESFGAEWKWINWEINADAHYMFPLDIAPFKLFGIGGLNLAGVRYKYESKDPILSQYNVNDFDLEVGLNIGAGAEYELTDHISGVARAKYIISSWDQLVINIGFLMGL